MNGLLKPVDGLVEVSSLEDGGCLGAFRLPLSLAGSCTPSNLTAFLSFRCNCGIDGDRFIDGLSDFLSA